MIDFLLNDTDFSDNVSDYKFSVSPISSGNSFVTANGEEINNITGYKQQLSVSLTKLSTEQVEDITTVLNNPNVTITSNAGANASGTYNVDGGYSVNLVKQSRSSEGFSGEWEISFTVSRIIKPDSGGGL